MRKKGKASGRPIWDLPYVSGTPLNTDEITAASAAFYGEIRHPTIDAVVQVILKFCTRAKEKDPTLQWSDLRLWNMDLRGAYQLISFRPPDAGLFGMELTSHIPPDCGSTPAAFQVTTRAIQWELKHQSTAFSKSISLLLSPSRKRNDSLRGVADTGRYVASCALSWGPYTGSQQAAAPIMPPSSCPRKPCWPSAVGGQCRP